MGSRYRNRSSGFSLLEVLLAVGILTAGITVLLQAFSLMLRTAALAQEMTQAVLFAEDTLQELEYRKLQGLIAEGPLAGTAARAGFIANYALTPEPHNQIYLLRLIVSWKNTRQANEIEYVTSLR